MNYLPRSLVTVNGTVALARAYYHCSHCGTGHVPWDQRLGLDASRLSPAVQPLVAWAGALSPFGQADEVLERLAGLRLSAATCRRVTEAAGAALQAQHRAGQAVPPPRQPPWDFTLPERDGQPFAGTVAYVGLDAFAVPTRAAGKAGVDGRMLYVGLLYDPRKEHTV